MTTRERKKYTIRKEIPINGNKWYTRKDKGGVSPCIAGTPQAWKGSTLSNCVSYAWGRVSEMEGTESTIGCPNGRAYPSDAQNWWGCSDGYERTQEISVGAVAVWERNDKKSGHVAVVEDIVIPGKEGECHLSDSALYGRAFGYYGFSNDMSKAGYRFLGFIKPKYDYYVEEPKKSIEEIAKEVLDGKWGVQPDRQKRLETAGYNYKEVQNKVNELVWEREHYYTVQQGDTLIKIGKKVGVSWRVIQKLNNLSWSDLFKLYKGQKLRIK